MENLLFLGVPNLNHITVFNYNISYLTLKLYVVTPYLNRLFETVQMSGYNICFYAEFTKIIPYYHQILPLI